MKGAILYFSGMGNSLDAAKRIGEETGLVHRHIAKSDPESLGDSEVLGVVFPVYAWGMPGMAEDFLKKLRLSRDTYVFAVAVCGGNPGMSLRQCSRMIRRAGGRLSAGFAITHRTQRPGSERNPTGLIKFMKDASGPSPAGLDERLDEIVGAVIRRESRPVESVKLGGRILAELLHPVALKSFRSMDRHFSMTENCDRCGICVRSCPAENIVIENGSLKWLGRCQQCMACTKVCPRDGIANTGADYSGMLLNPNASLKEMALR